MFYSCAQYYIVFKTVMSIRQLLTPIIQIKTHVYYEDFLLTPTRNCLPRSYTKIIEKTVWNIFRKYTPSCSC